MTYIEHVQILNELLAYYNGSITRLAKVLNCNTTSIRTWMLNEANPSQSTLEKIERIAIARGLIK